MKAELTIGMIVDNVAFRGTRCEILRLGPWLALVRVQEGRGAPGLRVALRKHLEPARVQGEREALLDVLGTG